MKTLFLTVILSLAMMLPLSSQPDINEQKKLLELLEQRKKKFSAYSNSIEKRSGIFGNKTKKDMQQSNEVLMDIVRADNAIISVLHRAVDFKNFEKDNLSYDINKFAEQMANLRHAKDTLTKQVAHLKIVNQELNRESKKVNNIKNMLIALLLLMIGFLIRRRKAVL